ncbi:MAG TPA: hypothetical protein DDY98_04060 [Ruminococcaceae bacterium]|nr:hypothetical protein [Oscillospiraceae bacterium]
MKVIGLDIGTTTVCGIALDCESGKIRKTVTLPNDSFLVGKPFEKIQSPEIILRKVTALCEELCAEFSPEAIGISGQMHGIVYLNEDGKAVSPLYTWQDESADQAVDGTTYAVKLSSLTGYKMASGFGGSTYYYHACNDLVPEDAVCFCTIHDYVAMTLAGRKTPLVHASDAASFGLFDLKTRRFDEKAMEAAGLNKKLFPQVTASFAVLGEYCGAKVCTAIGDNQASFLGSLKNLEQGLLVNMGTGGQVSMLCPEGMNPVGMEIRPLNEERNIAVGCSLCGGRAFAALAEFFSACFEMVSGEKPKNIYASMDKALAVQSEQEDALCIRTTLCGTRENPSLRGEIQNLGIDNFTPTAMMNGFLDGMVDELLTMAKNAGCKASFLVGSGNGIRKNLPLQKRFSDALALPLHIPLHHEEAAFGAVLSALVACGFKADLSQAAELIQYE